MEQFNDEHLMLKVKNGDLDSLAPLFEKYHIKLYNFFLRITHDKEISNDLTQNVFRRIISYRKSYDSESKFKSWMYQIARNVHLKHYQENKFLKSDYNEIEHIKQEGLSALEEIEFETKKTSLYEALKQLNAEEQHIIELSRFQGLKYKEISDITGNSVTAIKVKVHRAMHKLRELYFEIA
ncbi:MAG: sigma-70 family RNA polymerase sigma factor [Bacteroidales bacterium]|nr:sigma-70 family RNA polymerase sigma factor [Bacteroidales bacterium]